MLLRGFVYGLLVVVLGVMIVNTPPSIEALDNGLALTPPMGWNSWYPFGCDVSEKNIKDQANALVKYRLRAAGYTTVIVDDCWSGDRDADGRITANARFPSGMKALGDFLHSKYFKFGVYSSRGTRTCMDFTASEDHEAQDAQTFADWGIDYVKYDNCPYTVDGADMERRYGWMSAGLQATGRPIVFSIAMWEFKDWHPATGNLSRTSGDILDSWPNMLEHFLINANYAAYAHPGYWNDPDVLRFGGGMSTTEYRSYFSLWAISAAPLIISANLWGLPKGTLEILTNKEVIAVDQDVLGVQGVQIGNSGPGKTVWSRPLSNGDYAILFLNEDAAAADISFDGSWLGLTSYTVRDLWKKRNLGTVSGVYTASVESHGVVMLRISPRS